MSITETVLEMHFHKAIMDSVRDAFGLGPSGQMNFYKWSPQKECFVGFDQAYVKTQLGDDEFFDLLKTSAASQQYKLNDVFFGYFLQFKVVHLMRRRSTIYTPPTVTSLPHYRVELDTTKNKQTGVSQHELLYRLSKNKGSLVYYACPMVFDKTDLYEIEVNTDQLRLVELGSCQDIYDDNDNHYIYFDNATSIPIWKSEPHEGTAISPEEFVKTLVRRFVNAEPADSRHALLDTLTDLQSLGISEQARIFEPGMRRDIVRLSEESLMIVRFRHE
jgi:hypothetical protein